MNIKNIVENVNPYSIQLEDENRKRRLLNIFLLGISLIAIAILIISIVFQDQSEEGVSFLFTAIPVLLVLLIGIHFLGRKYVTLAGALFTWLLLVAIAFSDTPQQVLEGRSLFFIIAPVMISSFIIKPHFSYYAALIASLLLFILALSENLPMNYIGAAGFFLFAFVSWLASTAYENALIELKSINAELDQRVEDRTKELADANERLKALDKLKTLFVSNVSHELRTPITNIIMYLELLEHGKPEKYKQYLQILKDETGRLTSLVTDTLDLSRLELGTIKMNISMIDINQVCGHVVKANLLSAQNKNLTMEINQSLSLPRIWGDKEKITQIIQNLVTNAINYTAFGNIWVSTEKTTKNGQDYVCIQIKDTGMGIEDQDMEQLFEPFYRGAQLNQSAIPGSGLGLAISQEIAEYHSGTIKIDTKHGEGSTFSVYLPITDTPENIKGNSQNN